MSNVHNKYFAFISYKREDEEWAIWFHHELENYHLPVTLNGRPDLPSQFRPVFRDIDELKAGNLPEQIHNALFSSAFLIVICSPNSAKSEWVNKEILEFVEIGKSKGIDNIRNIFPFIVAGNPHSKDVDNECFPEAMLGFKDKDERIGGNVNESGRDMAFVKVLAGMLPNVEFSELWDRYERDKAEEERLKREERERFLRLQSRFVAERVVELTHNSTVAQLLALEVLPEDLDKPDRPFTLEAERALRQSAAQYKVVLNGHSNDISDLAFSSNGKLLASIDDFSIRLWDVDTSEVIRIINPGHPFGRCVRFTSDDKSIITAFGDGAIIIWQIETGEPIVSLDFNQVFQTSRPATCISSMATSLDGAKLAISTSEGDIFIIDFNHDKTSSVEIEPVLSIEFSSDGKMLVSTSYDGLIVWNLEDDTHGSLGLNENVEPEFAHASFSPNGDRVAFAFDYTIGIIDVSKEGGLITIDAGDNRVIHVSFCDNGKSVFAVSENGELIIWDIDTQKQVYRLHDALGDVSMAGYSVQTMHIAFVVNKRTIVVHGIRSAMYHKSFILGEESLGVITYSPDGTTLLTSFVENEKGELLLYDSEEGLIKQRLSRHTDKVCSSSFSRKGDLIVSASYDGTVCVWDANTGKMLKQLTAIEAIGEQTAFTNAVFSPNGDLVVASSYTGWVVIWDYNAGEIINKVMHGNNPIFALDYCPDGCKFASGSVNQDIRVWDVNSGQLKVVLEGHTGIINSIRYSPDGKNIISASDDRTIICWDANNGKIIWKNTCFIDRVISLNYSNDGKYFVAATDDFDKPIVVCDSQKGIILAIYKGLTTPANSVTFSPDGRCIAADTANGIIVFWDFPRLQELINQTRERLNDRQ